MSMDCPKCGRRAHCIDTRNPPDKGTTRRRYKCDYCVKRWSTLEQIVHMSKKRIEGPSLLKTLQNKSMAKAQAELRAELGEVLGFREAE